MKKPLRSTLHSKTFKIEIPESKPKVDIQKYIAMSKRSKQILEELHTKRNGLPIIGYKDNKLYRVTSLKEVTPSKESSEVKSWMKPTLGQITKKRQKVEATANFFNIPEDNDDKLLENKLGELQKIYFHPKSEQSFLRIDLK